MVIITRLTVRVTVKVLELVGSRFVSGLGLGFFATPKFPTPWYGNLTSCDFFRAWPPPNRRPGVQLPAL